MQNTLLFDLYAWLAAVALGYARLAPIFYMLPFFSSDIVTGVVRTAIIVLIAWGLWPTAPSTLLNLDAWAYAKLMAHETMIGLLLGVLLAWPFWIFHALGSIIDNQRGATLSSSISPATGVDTSELSEFFQLFASVVYLQGGGLSLLLDVVSRSYLLCDPINGCTINWPLSYKIIDLVVGKALVLASPVMAALLLSEMILGLLSRFAAQLNAFSISLTVKSMVAIFIVLLYFGPVLPGMVFDLGLKPDALSQWLLKP